MISMKTTRTLRGLIPQSKTGQKITLVVDDGRLTHGLRITDIQVWPARASQVGDATIVLATNPPSAKTPLDSSDNGQIAWVYGAFGTSQGNGFVHIIDPNHIVVNELIILADIGVNFADGLNYLITMQPELLTEMESAVVQIKNRQQNLN